MSNNEELQSQAVLCKNCVGWIAIAVWPEMKGDKDWNRTIRWAASEGHTVKIMVGRDFLSNPCECDAQPAVESKKGSMPTQLSLF